MAPAIALVLLAGIALVSLTCKDEIVDPGLSDIVFPDSNISYGKQVQPLFDHGCAFSGGCHGNPDPAKGVSLENYQDATNRVDVIVRFNPDASLLIKRIDAKSDAFRMPPLPRPRLSDNQIKGMKRWILEGARGDN